MKYIQKGVEYASLVYLIPETVKKNHDKNDQLKWNNIGRSVIFE